MISAFFFSWVVVPIVLVGNKIDLDMDADVTSHHAMSKVLIKKKDCLAMARKIDAIAYLESSAKLNYGVKEVFDMAFQTISSASKKEWLKKKEVMVI